MKIKNKVGKLSRDEILKMPPGRNMDRLIAENIFKWMGDDAESMRRPIGNILMEQDPIYSCEDYSTDILYAWQVIEEMNRKGWASEVIMDIHEYSCRLSNVEGIHESVLAYGGSNAPLAICRASLLVECELYEK